VVILMSNKLSYLGWLTALKVSIVVSFMEPKKLGMELNLPLLGTSEGLRTNK